MKPSWIFLETLSCNKIEDEDDVRTVRHISFLISEGLFQMYTENIDLVYSVALKSGRDGEANVNMWAFSDIGLVPERNWILD